MIILSEAPEQLKPSASRRDISRSAEAARLAGLQVYTIPPDFSVCETAENALWHMPACAPEQVAFWIGYIPEPERYQAMYDAALSKGARLINSPDEHLLAMEFHRYYERLGELTPRSMIVTSPDQCAEVERVLGYPVFVKDTIQSRKHDGWDVCIAADQEEVTQRVGDLLHREGRSRGYVIIRELVRLRHSRYAGNGFPAGREFRAFVLKGKVAALGYYWEGSDDLSHLAPDEKRTVYALASEASHRLGVPYLTVDIGQPESGEWIVIEVGDAQFAGLSQISSLKLWSRLKELL
ncbi:MAG: ATP-grasp domain-containing protein [Anaerolineae bacterium]|nr:ATP-grasp domain-containing protein [Anaerolineae bacterium]